MKLDLPVLGVRHVGVIAKPEPRKRTKARAYRQQRDRNAEIREHVFAREQSICRVCRLRPAASMHELQSRGSGGTVSKKNSIAVCGQLVGTETCCHTFLQQYDISYTVGIYGAEDVITFWPRTKAAAEWLRVQIYQVLESGPTPQIRGDISE